MVFGSLHIFLFITWHFETTSAPRKREINILVPGLMVLELASLKKKEEESNFSKFVFSASIKLG